MIPNKVAPRGTLTAIRLRRPPQAEGDEEVHCDSRGHKGHTRCVGLREEGNGEGRVAGIPWVEGPNGKQEGNKADLGSMGEEEIP